MRITTIIVVILLSPSRSHFWEKAILGLGVFMADLLIEKTRTLKFGPKVPKASRHFTE